MKRSEINQAYSDASACLARHHWILPPNPHWDITDFALGDFAHYGLTAVNLAAEPEYCEKIMYARRNQATPCHMHAKKKEDIICRAGELALYLSAEKPSLDGDLRLPVSTAVTVSVNGVPTSLSAGKALILQAGHRVTLTPGLWHSFWPKSEECLIGEVSTANDDANDNFFLDPAIKRFTHIEEDEPTIHPLLSEHGD